MAFGAGFNPGESAKTPKAAIFDSTRSSREKFFSAREIVHALRVVDLPGSEIVIRNYAVAFLVMVARVASRACRRQSK